jgi:Lon protease-like protein
VQELGLFPLPIVLVPTEQIPLHIFEPRYKELIGECVETEGEFGLVLATGDGAVHEIGTRARVTEVLEILEDGSLNVIVEGRERFRLLELTSGRSFATALVEPVEDDDEPPDPGDAARAFELFGELAAEAGAEVELSDSSPDLDWQLTAHVDLGADPKQELLTLVSPRLRMRRLVELLGLALDSVRSGAVIRGRASSNGRVEPPDSL